VGGGGGEKLPEGLRVINAAPHEDSVHVEFGLATDPPTTLDVPYGAATEYFPVVEGTILMRVKVPSDVLPSISDSLSIASGTNYTYLVTEDEDALAGTPLTDGQDEPNGGQFKIRFVNPVVRSVGIDCYMSVPDEGFKHSDLIVGNVAIKTASLYFDIDAGTYRVRLTENDSTKQLFVSDPVTFEEGHSYSVVLLEDDGGGKPYRALLLTDR
jgi:hypothetical protein